MRRGCTEQRPAHKPKQQHVWLAGQAPCVHYLQQILRPDAQKVWDEFRQLPDGARYSASAKA
jgi:hypothetical protein